MTRILVVDNHPMIGMGTKVILEKEGFEVDVEVDSAQVLQRINQQTYELIILDLQMPNESGLDIAKQIKKLDEENRVIIYTGYDIELFYDAVMDAGCSGIISKTSSEEQFITAIRCTLQDEVVIPVRLARQLRRKELVVEDQGTIVVLSPQEQEILLELQVGNTNKEIAKKIHMSKRYVERLLTNLFRKLEVANRTEAVERAVELGYIPNYSFERFSK